MTDLPTRNKAKNCWAELEFEHAGHEYMVRREVPTKISIKEDGQELNNLQSTAERNRYLTNIFGNISTFQQFRMIDAYDKEVNFLAQGNTTMKKILFSLHEDKFNSKRDTLLKLKHEREVYNKDKAVIYKHFPSVKRLELLKKKLSNTQTQLANVHKEELDNRDNKLDINKKITELQTKKSYNESNINKTKTKNFCYACRRKMTEEDRNKVITELTAKIESINIELTPLTDQLDEITAIEGHYKEIINNINNVINRINRRLMRLEGRLQQKDYKYTDKDVLVIKRAIDELNKFSTEYLIASIKDLEPIINSVLNKIGFTLSFDIDLKGRFDIILTTADGQYSYKDLSTGQRLILQIAFKLALLLDKGEEGLLIADEGMSALDRENLLHVINLFENLPFQLVFVLHNFDEPPISVKVINLSAEEEKDVKTIVKTSCKKTGSKKTKSKKVS
ncbi:MAG: hypothetical protein ACTSPD_10265 [Promethearchaeota archaeon]